MKTYGCVFNSQDHLICLLDIYPSDVHVYAADKTYKVHIHSHWTGGTYPDRWANTYKRITWPEFKKKYGITIQDIL